jgi:hypothetical protein
MFASGSAKYCDGLVEGDPVTLEVLCRLLEIPLEFRRHRIVVSVPASIVLFRDRGLAAGPRRDEIHRAVSCMPR